MLCFNIFFIIKFSGILLSFQDFWFLSVPQSPYFLPNLCKKIHQFSCHLFTFIKILLEQHLVSYKTNFISIEFYNMDLNLIFSIKLLKKVELRTSQNTKRINSQKVTLVLKCYKKWVGRKAKAWALKEQELSTLLTSK